MSMHFTAVRVACVDCGYAGTPGALELHSCEVQEFGGHCEDYPCCGHTDGDGCQTLPQHTSGYWHEAMTSGSFAAHFEHGSPEWYDAMDLDGDYEDGDDYAKDDYDD